MPNNAIKPSRAHDRTREGDFTYAYSAFAACLFSALRSLVSCGVDFDIAIDLEVVQLVKVSVPAVFYVALTDDELHAGLAHEVLQVGLDLVELVGILLGHEQGGGQTHGVDELDNLIGIEGYALLVVLGQVDVVNCGQLSQTAGSQVGRRSNAKHVSLVFGISLGIGGLVGGQTYPLGGVAE